LLAQDAQVAHDWTLDVFPARIAEELIGAPSSAVQLMYESVEPIVTGSDGDYRPNSRTAIGASA
jgi:hypothetical protein